MAVRITLLAALLLCAALPASAQGPHTLPSSLAPAGTPVLIPKEGGTGAVFSEGVAADWSGNIYSNQQDNNDRTMQLKVGADTSKAWRKATDDPNGMWLDTQNRLVICQQNAIVRVKAGAAWDNKTDTLYKYPSGSGQAFNDVTGDSKDNLYFTNFQGMTVYFRNGATGETKAVLSNVSGSPNGIEWDEERKIVYLHAHYSNKVVAYTVAADYSLTNPTDFATANLPDGITLDEQGNVYVVSFNDRVNVYSPAKVKLGEIVFTGLSGHQITNLAFGGADFKTLFMITNKGLYKLPMSVKGYKSGNYSVAVRGAAISPDANRRDRNVLVFENGLLTVRPANATASAVKIDGRAIQGTSTRPSAVPHLTR